MYQITEFFERMTQIVLLLFSVGILRKIYFGEYKVAILLMAILVSSNVILKRHLKKMREEEEKW